MLFNSVEFAIFFPVVTVAYFLLPYRWRWILLLIASYYFYMSWIPIYVSLLLLTTTIDYLAGIMMDGTESKPKRLKYLLCSLAANLTILFFFKYFNFFSDTVQSVFNYFGLQYHMPTSHLLLPVGVSFYTFQSIGYAIDVYRGDIRAERNFGIFALYVSFFPQLVAGPIERASNLLPQFRQNFDFDYERATNGLKLIAWGLFKKVVIADRLAVLVDTVYGNPHNFQGPGLLIGTLMFAWQIYCDFAGYSDIAVGTAQILGFRLMTNFDKPYWSRSLGELWRRWHISLTSWFRDYVYRSLGGTRTTKWRSARNVMVVFLITGVWHGASWTFILWGVFHGIALVLSTLTRNLRASLVKITRIDRVPRLHAAWQILITFSLWLFIGVFFRAKNVEDAFYILSHMFTGWTHNPFGTEGFDDFVFSLGLPQTEDFFIAVFAIILLETVHMFQFYGSIRQWVSRRPIWFRWALYYSLMLVILCFGVFNRSPFIYFQF